MLRIGLTGGIGTGKSTASKILDQIQTLDLQKMYQITEL